MYMRPTIVCVEGGRWRNNKIKTVTDGSTTETVGDRAVTGRSHCESVLGIVARSLSRANTRSTSHYKTPWWLARACTATNWFWSYSSQDWNYGRCGKKHCFVNNFVSCLPVGPMECACFVYEVIVIREGLYFFLCEVLSFVALTNIVFMGTC